MASELLLHLAHRLKFSMQYSKPFSGRRYLMMIADKIIGEPKSKTVIKTIYGFRLCIDPMNDKGVERTLYYDGTYEPGTLHIFKKLLSHGDVFLDVGSNIGLMTLFASRQVGPYGMVYCFEPEPNTFQLLKKNIQLNNATNVFPQNYALGSQEMETVIYPNLDINRGASSIVRSDGSEGKKIQVKKLDDFLEANNLQQVRLMKIDVEGYEMEMLKGAKALLQSDKAPILCIEYSKDVEHIAELGDVYDFLISVSQYRIFRFVSWKEKISQLVEVKSKEGMPDHDNIFCFLPKHLESVDPSIFANA